LSATATKEEAERSDSYHRSQGREGRSAERRISFGVMAIGVSSVSERGEKRGKKDGGGNRPVC